MENVEIRVGRDYIRVADRAPEYFPRDAGYLQIALRAERLGQTLERSKEDDDDD